MSRYLYQPIDPTGIRTRPIRGRTTKVSTSQFGQAYQKGSGIPGLVNSLPEILAGSAFRKIVDAILFAKANRRVIVWGLGAHVIKCGLNPILIDLMRRGFVSAIALNGAGAIHDLEIAMTGATSEEVEKELVDGQFGMAHETPLELNEAIRLGSAKNLGMGESIGCYLFDHPDHFPHREFSLLSSAYERRIPVSVHVAIGTDTIHNHPSTNGAELGKTSLQDFRLFTAVVRDLHDGGVYLNCGSAVILPEVFLKAVSLVRNLGQPLENFTTVNLDFIQQYRAQQNVLIRPTQLTGQGISLIGHHELLLPLLTAVLIETEK
ncbi:MAG: hypothetical protein U0V70_20450 [Terriglobia bacterium]